MAPAIAVIPIKLTKVIMVTAAGQKGKMIDCIKLGADEFLTKPFDKEEIISVINKLS